MGLDPHRILFAYERGPGRFRRRKCPAAHPHVVGVHGSVLWLVASDAAVQNNLRKEAAARSVDPGRLVFAERVPYAEYLSRLSAADLFLDTAPYNAGATASDALWAGLPVLTSTCDAFVGRMGARLLSAIGLSELVTTTPQAYEELAIELATNPEKLAAIKDKLARNRLTTPLFDTKRFIRHIEAAYTEAYRHYSAGSYPGTAIKFAGSSAAAFSGADRLFEGPLEAG